MLPVSVATRAVMSKGDFSVNLSFHSVGCFITDVKKIEQRENVLFGACSHTLTGCGQNKANTT